jgi:hypothetical protein
MVSKAGYWSIAVTQSKKPVLLLFVIGAALMGSAAAQPLSGPLNYNVKTMTFESWCQETQRYDAERCVARRPADVKAFEDYRAAVERYELQYLKQVQRDRDTRDSINRDPAQAVRGRQDSTP